MSIFTVWVIFLWQILSLIYDPINKLTLLIQFLKSFLNEHQFFSSQDFRHFALWLIFFAFVLCFVFCFTLRNWIHPCLIFISYQISHSQINIDLLHYFAEGYYKSTLITSIKNIKLVFYLKKILLRVDCNKKLYYIQIIWVWNIFITKS